MLPAFQATRAAALSLGGRLEEAELVARAGIRHPTASFWNLAGLASILGHLGRDEEGRATIEKLLELRPDFSAAMFRRFFGSVESDAPGYGARTHFFDGLYKAGLPRPPATGARS
jgi:hypothetical protein